MNSYTAVEAEGKKNLKKKNQHKMLLRTKAYVRLLRVFIHSCLCFMCCCLQVNIFLIELLHSEKLAQKGGKKRMHL